MIIKMLKKSSHDQRGSMFIGVILLVGLIVSLALIVSEVLRVYDLHEHLNDEIYRASNLAIKTAMHDSYRIDGVSKFDEKIAVDYFYSYLENDLKLNASSEKLEDDGDVAYKLVINSVEVNGDTVRMKVKATAYASPLFNLWNNKWEIPLEIVSRNIRTD